MMGRIRQLLSDNEKLGQFNHADRIASLESDAELQSTCIKEFIKTHSGKLPIFVSSSCTGNIVSLNPEVFSVIIRWVDADLTKGSCIRFLSHVGYS